MNIIKMKDSKKMNLIKIINNQDLILINFLMALILIKK
jgi:hypothetical protein